MSKRILMIVGDFSEDLETQVPFQALQGVGFRVDAVCPQKKTGEYITTTISEDEGYQTYTEKVGHRFYLNYDFDKVVPQDYHGIVLPGGRAPEYLRQIPTVLEYTKHFQETKKPIFSICNGIQILLALEGCLHGVTMGGYFPRSFELEHVGGHYRQIRMDQALVFNNFTSTPAYPGFAAALPPFIKQVNHGVTFDNKVEVSL